MADEQASDAKREIIAAKWRMPSWYEWVFVAGALAQVFYWLDIKPAWILSKWAIILVPAVTFSTFAVHIRGSYRNPNELFGLPALVAGTFGALAYLLLSLALFLEFRLYYLDPSQHDYPLSTLCGAITYLIAAFSWAISVAVRVHLVLQYRSLSLLDIDRTMLRALENHAGRVWDSFARTTELLGRVAELPQLAITELRDDLERKRIEDQPVEQDKPKKKPKSRQ
jgi:hypothetical protein